MRASTQRLVGRARFGSLCESQSIIEPRLRKWPAPQLAPAQRVVRVRVSERWRARGRRRPRPHHRASGPGPQHAQARLQRPRRGRSMPRQGARRADRDRPPRPSLPPTRGVQPHLADVLKGTTAALGGHVRLQIQRCLVATNAFDQRALDVHPFAPWVGLLAVVRARVNQTVLAASEICVTPQWVESMSTICKPRPRSASALACRMAGVPGP
jgi:hypothetical protein